MANLRWATSAFGRDLNVGSWRKAVADFCSQAMLNAREGRGPEAVDLRVPPASYLLRGSAEGNPGSDYRKDPDSPCDRIHVVPPGRQFFEVVFPLHPPTIAARSARAASAMRGAGPKAERRRAGGPRLWITSRSLPRPPLSLSVSHCLHAACARLMAHAASAELLTRRKLAEKLSVRKTAACAAVYVLRSA